jgi:hypothetical protein
MANWSDQELTLAVEDYFLMLSKETHGISYSKKDHWSELIPKLSGRTKSSIEMRHQNTSAVLIDLGLPYINGYKPLGNYPGRLLEIVSSYAINSLYNSKIDHDWPKFDLRISVDRKESADLLTVTQGGNSRDILRTKWTSEFLIQLVSCLKCGLTKVYFNGKEQDAPLELMAKDHDLWVLGFVSKSFKKVRVHKRFGDDLSNANIGYWEKGGSKNYDVDSEDLSAALKIIGSSMEASGETAIFSDIPDGITRDHILAAMAEYDEGGAEEFVESHTYDVLFDERRYSPPAVIRLASEKMTGVPLGRIKAGRKSKCFSILSAMGFHIVPKTARDMVTPPPSRSRVVGGPSERSRQGPPEVNWADIDETKREIGLAGEQFVLNYEKKKLEEAGKSEYLQDINWIAKTNPNAGYDFESREIDGTKIYIEVKATNYGENRKYMISANEVRKSEELGSQYRLYRVYELDRGGKMYILPGPVKEHSDLEAATYTAFPKGDNKD